jgi:hypothetical protein
MIKKSFNFYGFKVNIEGPFAEFFYKEYTYFYKKKLYNPNIRFIYADNKKKLDIHDYDISLPSNVNLIKNYIYYSSNTNFSFLIMLFESIVNMRNKILIHGVAYNKHKTIFIAGPDDTGKTSLAIKLSDEGAEIFSEDWSCVDLNGNVFPWPRKCHLFDYNFVQSHDILNKRINYSINLKKIKTYFKDLVKLNSLFLQKVYNYLINQQYYAYSFENLGGKTAVQKKKIDRFFWFQKKNVKKIQFKNISKQDLINRITGHYLYERSEYFRIYSRLSSLGNESNIISKYLIKNNEYRKKLNIFFKNFKTVKEISIPKKMNAKEVSDYIYKNI